MKIRLQILLKRAAIALLYLAFFVINAQERGTVVTEKIHSLVLEQTVTREDPDRAVSVYLPPGYDDSPSKRYPVVYLLHGIGDTNETWLEPWSGENPGFATVKEVLDQGILSGKFGEMIVVMPNERTHWFGSFYTNSSVTGDWETFTTRELVAYIDKNFRTLAHVDSRGIAGHSMGGYGALVLSMKHPETYSVCYGLNPALIDFYGDLTVPKESYIRAIKATSFDELEKDGDFHSMATVTVAQAFSPNPDKQPFYADLPYMLKGDKLVPNPEGFRKWREHSAVRMVFTYRENLYKLKGLRFDSGTEDEYRFIPIGCRDFSMELTNNGVIHIFEEYNGDHRNRLWGRHGRMYNDVFPYFWQLLENDE